MKPFNTIDAREIDAAKMAAGGMLSGYIGSSPDGGLFIKELESKWRQAFRVKHAVAVNSATSGLLAACMAIEVGPGDEVIVSPYTMSATAAAPKVLGAKLVWADIDPECYTLDPLEVSNKINRKTKAVIVTNLFGHPAHLRELRDICDAQGVWLIEDNAQAVYAMEDKAFTGTIGHIGVFSLNVHKQLQVGEGGICVTNDDDLDINLRAAMNHGEMRNSIVGLNLRMTEVTAAMAIEQLKKAPEIIPGRIDFWHELTLNCMENDIDIITPHIREGCYHSAYVWAAQLTREPKKTLPAHFRRGYLRPLYEIKAFKSPDFLPVVEEVERKMVLVELCSVDPNVLEIEQMVKSLKAAL